MKQNKHYAAPYTDMANMEPEGLMTASLSDQLHQDNLITSEDEILQRLQSIEMYDE